MRILRQNRRTEPPRLSIVLLDWSVRESLHTLDYLARQDVDRDSYEILWIEYFDRESEPLRERVDAADNEDRPAPVDTWIVMDVPNDVCHHKHLMYNIGLLAARGELVCFCDSDAMFRPGFVRSIFESFDADGDIVLHHDQIRNHLPRHYPFRFPAFDDVVGFGCNQWVNGKPLGLWDTDDPLHTRNYGASMTARRDDLIAIGGADMHTDYLGHVCGPYEMTFRLANFGRKEVWHQSEFTYHTWHPGQAGTVDYCGPHDGLHMSTTALEARQSGRIEPVCEHPSIASLHNDTGETRDLESLLADAIPPEWLRTWHRDRIDELPVPAENPQAVPQPPFGFRMSRSQRLRLMPLVAGIVWKFLRGKTPRNEDGTSVGRTQAAMLFARYLIRTCWINLACLKRRGIQEIHVVGDATGVQLTRKLAGYLGIRVRSDMCGADDDLPVVLTVVADTNSYRQLIQATGIQPDRIIAIPT